MKFCASLAFTDPDDYCELAVLAEEHGWDALVLSDHVVHPETIASRYPYAADGERPWEAPDPWPDVWVSIGAMGAVTRRLRFLTGVYVVPMRHPFHLAKALGTASVLTKGRVGLGLGLGWMRDEFDLLGEDFDARAARTEEMVQVMRKLWSGEMVEHHGRFYDFPRLQMSPGVPAEVPVYVGGRTRAALRRVARIGDGWIPDLLTLDELSRGVAEIRALRRELGRSESFDVIGAPKDGLDVDHFRRMQDAGVTHLCMIPWLLYGGDTRELRVKQDALARFGDEVIAKLA